MSISINDNGKLRPVGLDTNGFSINGIDFIGEKQVDKGTSASITFIPFPKALKSYKLLIFVLVDPGDGQSNQAYNHPAYGTGQEPFMVIPVRGMLAAMDRNSRERNGTRMWKFAYNDSDAPYLTTESADTNVLGMRIYSSYNSTVTMTWAVYALY